MPVSRPRRGRGSVEDSYYVCAADTLGLPNRQNVPVDLRDCAGPFVDRRVAEKVAASGPKSYVCQVRHADADVREGTFGAQHTQASNTISLTSSGKGCGMGKVDEPVPASTAKTERLSTQH